MVFQVRWNRPHMSSRFEHHGALVNPTMGLRNNYTVLWDCHNAILKKQKAEKTNHKGKQTQAKQKTKQKHPKRKIGIVIKASSVEKDVLCNARAAAAAEDRIETVMARQTGFEQEMIESDGSLREVWAYGTWRVCQKRQADSRAVPPHAGARKGQFGPLES